MRFLDQFAALAGSAVVAMAASCSAQTGALIVAGPRDRPECGAVASAIQHLILTAYASGLQESVPVDDPWRGQIPAPMLAEFDRLEQASAASFCTGLRANMKASDIAFVDEVPLAGRQPGKFGAGVVVRATIPQLGDGGNSAMIRVGLTCGGACSGAATYYLVRQEARWKVAGLRPEWPGRAGRNTPR